MENLPPTILDEFENHGHWVMHKTMNKFSSIPIDQAHEQNNRLVKGSGSAVGLTENPTAFRKWMLAGPEQARLLTEFETCFTVENAKHCHHEEGLSLQKSFKQEVMNLSETIREMGNPFLNETEELLTLDSHDVLNQSVVGTVRKIEALGKQQYNDYFKSVLVDCEKSIHDPIKKNSLRLFKCPIPKGKGKQADKIERLKTEVNLFSSLYIIAQHRVCDMDTFFSHENHPFPPSLSDRGKLRLGKKSDLLACLIKTVEEEPSSLLVSDETDETVSLLTTLEQMDGEPPTEMKVLELAPETLTSLEEPSDSDMPNSFDVKVLVGAAVVHLLSATGVRTFEDYASDVFLPYIMQQLENLESGHCLGQLHQRQHQRICQREKRKRYSKKRCS